MVSVTIRIDLSSSSAVGPGKIRLLEHIRDTGSISAAGRAMEMSYRRAWLLVEELNNLFREPVATTKLGGRTGGGAELTPKSRLAAVAGFEQKARHSEQRFAKE